MKKFVLVAVSLFVFLSCSDSPVSPTKEVFPVVHYPLHGYYIMDTYMNEKRNADYPPIVGITEINPYPFDTTISLYNEIKNFRFRKNDNVTAHWDSVVYTTHYNPFIDEDYQGLIKEMDIETKKPILGENKSLFYQIINMDVNGLRLYVLPTTQILDIDSTRSFIDYDTIYAIKYYVYYEIDNE